MASVSAYYRPATIEEALTLLERPDAVLLGGGTKVNTSTGLATAGPVEMVVSRRSASMASNASARNAC